MPTSRTRRRWRTLLAGAVAAFALIGAPGCAADTDGEDGDEEIGEQEGAIGAAPGAAGITAGSLEEEGVLLLANDRAVTADTLVSRAKLTRTAAKGIVAFRTDPEGKPRWYATIDEVDARPSTTSVAFRKLVADARANGYVEAPGFDEPTQARIVVPSNLGRPPTANDVTVEAGFDGKTPAQVVGLVRGRLTNTLDPSNDRFVDQTITTLHKNFTIAVGNFYAQNSPHAAFIQSLRALGAERFTLLGTMSALKPTILLAETGAGVKTYWSRGAGGRYERLTEVPKYPVVIRARIRVGAEGPGVRVFYPAWSAKQLTGPTTVVIEGG